MDVKMFVIFMWIILIQIVPFTANAKIPSSNDTSGQRVDVSWCPDGYHLGTGVLDVCQLMSCLNYSNAQIPTDILSDAQQISTSYNTVLVCKQPTSNFNNCRKTILKSNEYSVFANESRIFIRSSKTFLQLGEFVVFSDKKVSVCDSSKATAKDMPVALPIQCMPFELPSKQCKLLSNGSLSAINTTLNFSPSFFRKDASHDDYELCYGMSDGFVNCQQRGGIPSNYSKTLPDMTLYTNLNVVQVYSLGSYVWTKDRNNAVVCIEPTALQPNNKIMTFLIGIAMSMSAVFLFVTLLAHFFFPSLNYHAKPLLCHIISLLVMYVSTTVRYFHSMYDTTDLQCYTLFSITYVSTLGAFFWLSVLAFDLWRVFANLRPTVSPISSRGKRRKFICQCIYAWGTPITLCIIALIVASNKNVQNALNLQFPLLNLCWFATNESIFAFMYAPIIIILIGNVIFFTLTVINLHRASRGTEILNKKVSRQLFKIFIKLFVVMGLFWFAEFISWVFRRQVADWSYPTDLINSLQGVVIFFVYVFKKKTLIKIKEKFGYSDTNNGLTTSTSGLKTTTTNINLKKNHHRKAEITSSTLSRISINANLNTIA